MGGYSLLKGMGKRAAAVNSRFALDDGPPVQQPGFGLLGRGLVFLPILASVIAV
jgi:hypothetical protein